MTTPPHLSDRYELGEILGFGGMSEVHLGRDLHLHRDVAIKVLRADLARNPSFYLRFRREAQNAAALNHPAIVAVYDTGEAHIPSGPLPYIVMEYVDGITLRDIVNNDGPIPPRKAIEIIADVCQGLHFSHQHGIIHRDVKPANIMISRTGAVKVMDFGIARALTDTTGATKTATVVGTPQYLSPEQARGDTVDARSDVYSLGCVLYEILTGQTPFAGASPLAVAYQHVREAPAPPSNRHSEVTPELDAVALTALAKNPDNRYQTAAEMRADLIRVYNRESPKAPKVLTDAERTSLLAATVAGRYQRTDDTSRTQGGDGPDRRRGTSVRRWLLVAAGLAALTVAIAVLINVVPRWFSGSRTVKVPQVAKMSEDDATVTLQKAGFDTRTQHVTDAQVAPNQVVSTNPKAGDVAETGSTVTLNVSIGPEQRQVPDVQRLSYQEAVWRLTAAGFGNVKQVFAPSTPEQQDKVLGTNPPADQPTPVTFEISVLVGTGPEIIKVPDTTGQSAEQAKTTLTAAGFTNVIDVQVDSPNPAGAVVGTLPTAGQSAKETDLIRLRESKGNQFIMPDITGQFWDDLLPQLQSLGWTGAANTVQTPAGDDNRAKVLRQDPPPGTPIRKDGNISLTFGQ